MKLNRFQGLALALCGVVACGEDNPIETRDDGALLAPESPAASSRNPSEELVHQVPVGEGQAMPSGTCARPIEIRRFGVVFGSGNATTWRGSTVGMPNALHPGCAAHDSTEVVFRYTVPEGVQAVEVTTAGSRFDTVVYARTDCGQNAADLVCNDNSYDHAPQSTIFLTNLVPGQSIFLVVDGNGDSDRPSGTFTLSVRDVPYGQPGMPCHAVRHDANRCSLRLVCSEGAAADGTDLCVPTVQLGRACDPRGFSDACVEGASCVVEGGPESAISGPVCRPNGH